MTLNDQVYQEILDLVEADFHELSIGEIREVYGVPEDLALDYDELFDFCVNVEIENLYK